MRKSYGRVAFVCYIKLHFDGTPDLLEYPVGSYVDLIDCYGLAHGRQKQKTHCKRKRHRRHASEKTFHTFIPPKALLFVFDFNNPSVKQMYHPIGILRHIRIMRYHYECPVMLAQRIDYHMHYLIRSA